MKQSISLHSFISNINLCLYERPHYGSIIFEEKSRFITGQKNLQWNLHNCQILCLLKKDLQVPRIARWWTREVTFCPEHIPFYSCSFCCHQRLVIVSPKISKSVASILKAFTWKFDICLVLIRWCGRSYNLVQILVFWFSPDYTVLFCDFGCYLDLLKLYN